MLEGCLLDNVGVYETITSTIPGRGNHLLSADERSFVSESFGIEADLQFLVDHIQHSVNSIHLAIFS